MKLVLHWKDRGMQSQLQQAVKTTGDVSAYGAFFGWLVGILPSIATLVTVLWFTVLLVEKFTGKQFHELVRCAWIKIFGK